MTQSGPTPDGMTPPPLPPGEPPPAPRLGTDPLHRVIAGLALLLLVVLALVATAPYWAAALPWGRGGATRDLAAIRALQSRLDGDDAALKDDAARLRRLEAADTGAIKALSARVARLESAAGLIENLADRVARLEARPPPAAPKPPPAAADTAALEALKDQVAKLAAASATAGGKLAKLEAELGAIGARDRAEAARIMALADLRAAIDRAAPYGAELAAVEALASDKAKIETALAPLAAAAKTGLPSLAALTERFDRETAPAILRARGVTRNPSFGAQILARLERLVVIRRIDPGAPLPHDPVEAAVVRAEDALKSGDLRRAVAALDQLPAAAAAAAAPWLGQAKRRLAAEAALDTLWQAETAPAAAAASRSKP
jgi:hypothetical protein